MLAIVHTRACLGIDAPPVTVEVQLTGGLPNLQMVGLPDSAVRESRDRVRSAILESGYNYPQRRITINLAPADLPKDGARFDLAIAVGVLVASEQLLPTHLDAVELIGELALSGVLRPVPGVLPAKAAANAAGRRLVLPRGNRTEAGLTSGPCHAYDHLADVCALLQSSTLPDPDAPTRGMADRPIYRSLDDVVGQDDAKWALVVAAAGGHNLLMAGPPGTGKTMLARRLPGLLPPLTEAEALEVATVQSVAGRWQRDLRFGERPFRDPHHTASAAALIGGGNPPRPGEVSLAHRGVLFLDELPEFERRVLEVMREPLETGEAVIARARLTVRYPARFQLIAAMNPCPAGLICDGGGLCRCAPEDARRYRDRLSAPLLDRIDLHIQVAPVPAASLLRGARPNNDSELRAKVTRAHARQWSRQGSLNRDLDGDALLRECLLPARALTIVEHAAQRLGLSARAVHRLLRVARTLADLDDRDAICDDHVLAALSFRQRDLVASD